MLNYSPSPTGDKFLKSKAFLKLIMGPVGGGKSTVALMDLVDRAVEQRPFNNVRRTKFIILRNTIAQLKATVKPLMDTWFVTMTKGTMGQWRLSDNVFEAKFKMPDGTVVHSEFVLMAADTPDDVRRHVRQQVALLGPGGGFVFQQVHNILANIPPENIVAMFEAAGA